LNVDISTFMVKGQAYTVSLKSVGIGRPNIDTINSALQYVAGVSAPSIKLVGGFYGLFADQFDVTFTYSGDGSDVIANVVGRILDATNSGYFTELEFVGAYTGATGTPTEGTAAGGGFQQPSLIPDTSTLVLIVLGLGLVVFIASGGPKLIKGATGS
jgi:hypothetical protein